MTPRTWAAPVIAIVFAATALCDGAAETGPRPPAEFPLGAWVRAGRPVLVRAPGARRVRGGGAPWALPQGAAADEFLLKIPRADVTLRDLEIDDGAGHGTRTERLDVRSLPSGGTVRASFTGPARDDVVLVGAARLPTVPEAWLLFDDVGTPPDGLPPDARAALDAWRAGPRAGAGDRAAFQPLLTPPGPAAFAASAEAAVATPRLPGDVALALLVTALAEIAVLLLAAHRSPVRRAGWLAAAPVACLLWLVADARLPGAVRATLVRIEGPADQLVLLRLDAPRGGTVAFRVPADAGAPTFLQFDGDDRAAVDAEIGRDVRVTIPAGQSRLVAWRLPGEAAPAEDAGTEVPTTSPALDSWLASLSLDAVGPASSTGRPELEDAAGFRPVRARAVRVAPRAATRK